jgi:predicted DNA binding CopG/RHH family protein
MQGRPTGTTKEQVMKPLSIRLPASLVKDLEKEAARKGLSLTTYIRMILVENYAK